VVELADDVRMTVLVPNADEAERSQLPGGGAPARLSWAPEHIHLVRESADFGGVDALSEEVLESDTTSRGGT